MKNSSKAIIILLFICSLIMVIPRVTYANAAEPPSIVILINNPPKDLSISLITDEKQLEAKVRKVAWESYYIFYSSDMQANDNYIFRITTKDESFECTFNEELSRYNNVITLNMSTHKMKTGVYPFRSFLLICIRLIITLLIEGIIFWLFGFRKKRSWIIFLVINLITQGILNIYLNNASSIISTYLIFGLIFGEVFVFIAEIILFRSLIDEHKKRVVIYTLLANLVSLVAGGYLIIYLPI